MQTPYDWVTIALFAGLIVIFLQRSTGRSEQSDTILHYLPPSIGCAVANYLGNEGHHIPALAAIVANFFYIWKVIKPFKR